MTAILYQWGNGLMDSASALESPGNAWNKASLQEYYLQKAYHYPSNRRKINKQLKQQIIKFHPIEVKETDVICNKCRLKYFYKQKPETNSKSENEINENSSDEEFHPPLPNKAAFASPPSVRLNIPSTPKSHSRCFICKRPGPKLIVVPSEARFTAFVQRNVIIKSGTRCCPVHMNDSSIKDEALKSVKAAESAYVNRDTVLELLNKLRESCKKSNRCFDFTTLNNEEYVDLTGLSKAAFEDICYCIEGHIRNTPVRDVHTTVGSWNTIQDAFITTKRSDGCMVESANARLKRWKYLESESNQTVCNKYLPPLSSSTDDDERQAQQMLQLVIHGNSLQAEIEEGNLEKSRAVWIPIDDTELESFLRLTEDILRTLTCGVYQLKLCS
ncbi:hypothetical protein MAR_017752, partial [Mya arenaria]